MRVRARSLVRHLVVLALGTLALLVAAPSFLVFMPFVVGAYVAARLGIVPRFLHRNGESVKIVGGPSQGLMALVEITVVADRGREADVRALVERLVENLASECGTGRNDGPLPVADAIALAWAQHGEHARLLFGDGATDVAAGAAEVPPVKGWTDIRADLLRCLRDAKPRAALELSTHVARDFHADVFVMGERPGLERALMALVAELRHQRGVETWTSGWVRHAEREAHARSRGTDQRKSA